MIRIAILICVLAVYAQGTAPAVSCSRLSLGQLHISGGRPIAIRIAPYQVSIQLEGKHYCGSSIISRYHALTAGHCVLDAYDVKDVVVHSRSNNLDKGDKHHVVKSFRHKLYNMTTMDYNVAIFKVAEPFTLIFNDRRPVKIVDIGEVTADNAPVLATGWGAAKVGGPISKKLMAVEMSVVNREVCAKTYSNLNVIVNSRMMCAGSTDQASGKDICQGDAGGPLVSKESGKQVGIISWGFGCAQAPEYPTLYVNLADQGIHDFVSEAMEN